MDASTVSYYAANAASCAARYDEASVDSLHTMVRTLASTTCRVLEIGGGSGRDAAFLFELGCDVTFTDACREMVDRAVGIHPELAKNARVRAFPLSDDDELLEQRFDLVLCIAVIMHFDDTEIECLARQLATMIVPGGHLVLSHSTRRLGLIDGRDEVGRLIYERPAEVVVRLFEPFGFELERQLEDSDGLERTCIQWISQVLEKVA